MKLGQKTFVLVALPLVFQLAGLAAVGALVWQESANIEILHKAQKTLLISETIAKCFYQSALSLRAYESTRSQATGAVIQNNLSLLSSQLDALKQVAPDQDNVKAAVLAGSEGVRLFRAASERIELGGAGVPLLSLKSTKSVIEKFLRDLDLIGETQQQRIDKFEQGVSHLNYLVCACLFVIFGGNFLLVFLAFYLNLSVIRRLAVVISNTTAFAEQKQISPPVKGTDEIAELDTAFHEMAKAVMSIREKESAIHSMVSHDLRSPLLSLKMTLEMLSAQRGGATIEEVLPEFERAKKSIEKMIALANDFLALQKLEGQMELNLAVHSAKAIIADAADSLKELLAAKELVLKITGEDLEVLCDDRRIEQILANLIANAIRFAPAGSEITVNVEKTTAAVLFSVTDQGPGFHPANDAVPYSRFSEDSARKGAHFGIGLYICNRLVELHGGVMTHVTDSRGTTFSFSIPGAGSAVAV